MTALFGAADEPEGLVSVERLADFRWADSALPVVLVRASLTGLDAAGWARLD
jgi:hypothetical protein